MCRYEVCVVFQNFKQIELPGLNQQGTKAFDWWLQFLVCMGDRIGPQDSTRASIIELSGLNQQGTKAFFFMDFILEENAHGLALKFSQNHGNLENYKHGTVK